MLLTYLFIVKLKKTPLFVCYSFNHLWAIQQKKHLLTPMCCRGTEVLQEQKEVGRVIYIISAIFFLMAELFLRPYFFFLAFCYVLV